MRLIDADNIIKEIYELLANDCDLVKSLKENGYYSENTPSIYRERLTCYREFKTIINEQPTVENIAHWIADKIMIKSPTAENYRCSNCNFHSFAYKYCPHCGAKMEELTIKE